MTESPAFVKMFDFVAWVIPLSVKFPREHRFVLAANLQRVAFASQEALIRAGHGATPAATLEDLAEAAVHLAQTRFYLRLGEHLGFITLKQYEFAAERLRELGRLIRAWQRTCQSRGASSINTAVSTASSS